MHTPSRILLAFGTRPEAIKLFPLAQALAADERFTLRICVTGQHRELLDQVLEVTGIRPDHDLGVMQAGQSLDSLTANILTGIGSVLDTEKPDWVVVQGDTTSAMCASLAAYYRKVPVAHVEAGLRSGNIHHPWPEEVNRKVIAGIAALHFAPTETAALALRRENVDPARIHVTGNTVIDALHWMKRRLDQLPSRFEELGKIEQRFARRKIIAVTCHRRENFGAGLQEIARAIRQIANRDDVAVVFPMHPNPNVKAAMGALLSDLQNVALIDPLEYPQFVRLLDMAHLVLSDSGGVQEEAPAFGKPVLVLRETTERPEGIEAGTAQLVGTDAARIVAEVSQLLDDETAYAAMARAHNPYGDGKSGQRIVELLAGASE